MSNRSRPSRQRETAHRCTMCDRLTELHDLTKCGYEAPYGSSSGDGRVCRRCLADLPPYVMVGAVTWQLVLRAP